MGTEYNKKADSRLPGRKGCLPLLVSLQEVKILPPRMPVAIEL
jgi:hypothetical protein